MPTSFNDGPAKGQKLMLKRAPIYLRVVEAAGKWDALDQVADEPAANETIYAYKVNGQPGSVHINMGRGRGGFYTMADYSICDPQPTDAEMRTREAWCAWCESMDTGSALEVLQVPTS